MPGWWSSCLRGGRRWREFIKLNDNNRKLNISLFLATNHTFRGCKFGICRIRTVNQLTKLSSSSPWCCLLMLIFTMSLPFLDHDHLLIFGNWFSCSIIIPALSSPCPPPPRRQLEHVPQRHRMSIEGSKSLLGHLFYLLSQFKEGSHLERSRAECHNLILMLKWRTVPDVSPCNYLLLYSLLTYLLTYPIMEGPAEWPRRFTTTWGFVQFSPTCINLINLRWHLFWAYSLAVVATLVVMSVITVIQLLLSVERDCDGWSLTPISIHCWLQRDERNSPLYVKAEVLIFLQLLSNEFRNYSQSTYLRSH